MASQAPNLALDQAQIQVVLCQSVQLAQFSQPQLQLIAQLFQLQHSSPLPSQTNLCRYLGVRIRVRQTVVVRVRVRSWGKAKARLGLPRFFLAACSSAYRCCFLAIFSFSKSRFDCTASSCSSESSPRITRSCSLAFAAALWRAVGDVTS